MECVCEERERERTSLAGLAQARSINSTSFIITVRHRVGEGHPEAAMLCLWQPELKRRIQSSMERTPPCMALKISALSRP